MISTSQTRALLKLIVKANKVALDYYYRESCNVSIKEDGSPVTDADHMINNILIHGLRQISPAVPIVSEESSKKDNLHLIKHAKCFWLLDPIDGTKGFVGKNGIFTINVGLILDNTPIFGMISAPLFDEIYYTENGGAFCSKQGVRAAMKINPSKKEALQVLISPRNSPSTTRDISVHIPNASIHEASSSYKFCILADGRADCYFHFSPTYIWDIAAGHAIVNAAGGKVLAIDGEDINYNNEAFINPSFYAFNHINHATICSIISRGQSHEPR
jgi:3'(2'), 5'-bisphosphate nucleotidase